MKKEKQFITAFTGGQEEVEFLKNYALKDGRGLSYLIREAMEHFIDLLVDNDGDIMYMKLIAATEGSSLSSIIRLAIKEYVDREAEKNANAGGTPLTFQDILKLKEELFK